MTAQHPITTYFVSCTVDVPPLIAQAAFDAEIASNQARASAIVVTGGRLLTRGPTRVSAGVPYAPYRSQRALIVAGWRSWPGDLELLPWSDRRTELGFAPGGATFRRPPRAGVVLVAHELLTHLAGVLEDWAEQPLRELSSHTTAALGHLQAT